MSSCFRIGVLLYSSVLQQTPGQETCWQLALSGVLNNKTMQVYKIIPARKLERRHRGLDCLWDIVALLLILRTDDFPSDAQYFIYLGYPFAQHHAQTVHKFTIKTWTGQQRSLFNLISNEMDQLPSIGAELVFPFSAKCVRTSEKSITRK